MSWPAAVAPLPLTPEHLPEDEVPFSDGMLGLPRFATPRILIAAAVGGEAAILLIPGVTIAHMSLPRPAGREHAPRLASLSRLTLPQIPLVHGTLVVERGIESLAGTHPAAPSFDFSGDLSGTPARMPRLKLAEGRRYAVEFRGNRIPPPTPEPTDCVVLPADVALPHRDAAPASPPIAAVQEEIIPEASGLAPLAFREMLTGSKPALSVLVSKWAEIPQPLRPEPIRPSSKLEPLDAKPIADVMKPDVIQPDVTTPAAPPPGLGSSGLAVAGKPVPVKAHLWTHAAGFWKHAPRDLKMLMFAIPALLALALHPVASEGCA